MINKSDMFSCNIHGYRFYLEEVYDTSKGPVEIYKCPVEGCKSSYKVVLSGMDLREARYTRDSRMQKYSRFGI